jgi:asparagine synthase (glutamine-hydrolysing)
MGFSTPLATWFRGELKTTAEYFLFCKGTGLEQLFKKESVRSIWHQHQRGIFDHSQTILSMVVYEIWWQTWSGKNN